MEEYEAEVLIVGVEHPDDIFHIREEDILESFPSEVAAPFDVHDEADIEAYIRDVEVWDDDLYFRVYAPGHFQRMNIYYEGVPGGEPEEDAADSGRQSPAARRGVPRG